LKLIACKVLFRELSMIAATSENFVDATYLRQGLHDTPELLYKALQDEIDKIDAGDDLHTFKSPYTTRDFDAILLGYGLCANGVVGVSSKKYKIVVPRAHDCITLFLGSKEKYKDYFDKHGGTFWYNASWNENSCTPSEQTDKEMLEIYTERYGEENAQYLLEAEMTENYNRCTYIKWDELDFPRHEQYTKDAAVYREWQYDCVLGDSGLLRDFIGGNWDEERFLTVLPGEKIAASYEGAAEILKVEA
jgi:hypothetical protein